MKPDDPLVTEALEVMELACMVHTAGPDAGGWVVMTRHPIGPPHVTAFRTEAEALDRRRRLVMADILEAVGMVSQAMLFGVGAQMVDPSKMTATQAADLVRGAGLPNQGGPSDKVPGDSEPGTS